MIDYTKEILKTVRTFSFLASIAAFTAAEKGYLNAIFCGLIGFAVGHVLGKAFFATFFTDEYIIMTRFSKKILIAEHCFYLFVPLLFWIRPFRHDLPLFIGLYYFLAGGNALLNSVVLIRMIK